MPKAVHLDDVAQASTETSSLAHFLMTMDWNPSTRVFSRADGWVYGALEYTPASAIERSNDQLANNNEMIARGIGGLQPDDAIFATTFYLSRRDDEKINSYEKMMTSGDELLRRMSEARVKFVRDGAERPLISFPGTERTFRTNRLRVMSSIMIPPRRSINVAAGMMDFMKSILTFGKSKDGRSRDASERRFESQYEEQARLCRTQIDQLRAKLYQVGCDVRDVGEVEYMRTMWELLYPLTGHRNQVKGSDAYLPLDMRIPLMPYDYNGKSNVISCAAEGIYWGVATLHGSLDKSWPGIISLPNEYLKSSILDHLDQGFVTISAQCTRKSKMETELANSVAKIQNGAAMPGIADKALEDRQRAQRWVSADGRRLMRTELTVACWGTTAEEAEERVNRLRDKMNDVVAKMRTETKAAPTFFLRALPGNSFPPVGGAYRDKLLADRQVADLLPIFHRSRGTSESLMLLHNVNGGLMGLSPWGGNSQGGIIAGRPGQGKSVFACCLVMDALRYEGTQAIFIDKGKSYNALTLLFGDRGLYLNVARGGLTTNILWGTYEQASKFAAAFIKRLCTPPGVVGITPAQSGLLDKIIRKVFEERQSRTTYLTWDDLKTKYPDAIIAEAQKSLPVQFITPELHKKASERTEDTSAKIYFRYNLISVTSETNEVVQVREAQSIPNDLQQWLSVNHYLLDVEEGKVVILHEEAKREEDLRNHRFLVQIDKGQCSVLVSQPEDVRQLESCGVKFMLPPAIYESRRKQIQAEIAADPQHAKAPADVIEGEITRALQKMGGVDLYNSIEGSATIQQEVFLSDVGRELELLAIEDEAARDLQSRIAPFYGDGANKDYFDGRTTLSFEGLKVCDIELGSFADSNDEHIVTSVLAAILQSIRMYVTTVKPTKNRCIIAIDEAWQLIGQSELVADSITNLYRTGRKHAVATFVISQSLLDFTENANARDIFQNAPNRYILRQPELALTVIGEQLGISKEKVDLMSSLRTEPGVYSQILIDALEHSPPVFDVAVFIPTPYQYWIATTKPTDKDIREVIVAEIRKKNPMLSEEQALPEAIQYCADRWPQGYVEGQ